MRPHMRRYYDGEYAQKDTLDWKNENHQDIWDFPWSYKSEEIGVIGPEMWGTRHTGSGYATQWPLCQIGRHQSPVDIQTDRLVYDHSLKPIEISGGDLQLELIVTNVGQDLRLSLLSDQIILSGGPFSYEFQVVSMHIKFGSVSTRGSDHRVDGRNLPGELQIYAFNRILYKNFSDALSQPHGIVAVSVFFKLCNISNKDILGIVAAAEKTIFKGQTFQLRGLELRSLISSTTEYMTYDGSLPFPGCHETVKWIILNHPISVSETELKTLRRLRVANTLWSGSMADNVRPVQAINHRTISTNINFNSVVSR
ncbi:Carbonic anhydrase XIII [Fasciola gigantica]|uniref:Carbonic anhydrase XIII n=1 Tax=Fasciola gigantica TaxID=46835 RepID=A0A504YCI5_FASGI|nr:Carbonic anhydrase XIII [Fasciola gigantica]